MGVEEDCVCSSPKIFVGQIPVEIGREDLLSLFELFGPVQRIDMLTPRQLNVMTHSAMIWFDTWTDVEKILEASEVGQIHLDGLRKLVIRIADPPKRGDTCLGIKPRKLFIGQIPKEVKDGDVEKLFAQFGTIEEFEVPKRLAAVSCAFVRYQKWSQAETAIRHLNDRYRFPESKRALVVKFADAKIPDSVKAASHIGEKRPLTPDDRSECIKRQLPIGIEGRRWGTPLEMGYLSSRMDVPMGLGTLTGMGRVEWIGINDTLPVSVPSFGLENKPKTFLQGMKGESSRSVTFGGVVCTQPLCLCSSHAMWGPHKPVYESAESSKNVFVDVPPVGPNGKLGKGFSDPKVKEWTLFVGQIPHQADEYTLWDVFRPFGEILELNVLRKDGKHKGCAFVTYETKEMSLKAIEKLDGSFFPWDAHQRKIVVRFREKNPRN